MIYFDNAATTRPYPEVLAAYVRICEEVLGNPSSANGLGTVALSYLEKARKQIMSTLGLDGGWELIFTSGATESNNTAILGIARRHAKEGKHLITSEGEHDSVLNVFRELEKEGFSVTYLNLDKEGRISLKELEAALTPDTTLVSLMNVNNEVGTIYPMEDFSKLIRSKTKAVFMSDLTQGLGKVPVDFDSIDAFTMSGHKVGGLKSSGLLGIRKGVLLDPLILGGGQEDGLRSGTVNVPLACSLATALRLYMASMPERNKKASALKDYLYEELSKMSEQILLTSPKEGVSPFVLNFALLHYKASVMVEALSKQEIYVSTRSACSSRAHAGSHVLTAMGYGEDISSNAIRISFEGNEELKEGQDFLKALQAQMEVLKKAR